MEVLNTIAQIIGYSALIGSLMLIIYFQMIEKKSNADSNENVEFEEWLIMNFDWNGSKWIDKLTLELKNTDEVYDEYKNLYSPHYHVDK